MRAAPYRRTARAPKLQAMTDTAPLSATGFDSTPPTEPERQRLEAEAGEPLPDPLHRCDRITA